MKSHSKLEVAKTQLDRAIMLYFEGDYYSAATLAGASEEILGKFLDKQGSESDLKNQIRTTQALGERLFGEQYNETHVASMINDVRNWLKHFTEGKDLEFDEEEAAADLIDRASNNYSMLTGLTGEETEDMRRFLSSRIDPHNAAVRSQLPNA